MKESPLKENSNLVRVKVKDSRLSGKCIFLCLFSNLKVGPFIIRLAITITPLRTVPKRIATGALTWTATSWWWVKFFLLLCWLLKTSSFGAPSLLICEMSPSEHGNKYSPYVLACFLCCSVVSTVVLKSQRAITPKSMLILTPSRVCSLIWTATPRTPAHK